MTSNGIIVFDLILWRLVFLRFGRGFPISAGLRSKSPDGVVVFLRRPVLSVNEWSALDLLFASSRPWPCERLPISYGQVPPPNTFSQRKTFSKISIRASVAALRSSPARKPSSLASRFDNSITLRGQKLSPISRRVRVCCRTRRSPRPYHGR